MPLRSYQTDAIRQVYASLKVHNSVMLQMPTGSGKTHVAMEIIHHGLKHGRRIAFCVDRITLLDQTLDKFIEEGIEIGVVQADHPLSRPSAPVQIVSLQTLARRSSNNWPLADLFIIDEAHVNYDIVRKVMKKWNGLKYIGLSATPFTRGLGLVWQDLVVATTTAELIEQGYLSDYIAYAPSQPDLKGVRRSGADFATPDLEERMNVLTGDIVLHYKQFAFGKKALCFTPTVAYAQTLAAEFVSQGISADHVSGYDTESRRQRVLEGYKSGEIKVVTNCEVLTKGFDQPDIEVGILARPTRSLSLHIQMCGRFIRAFEGKDKAIIFDHAGNIERLGFPDDDLPRVLDRGEPNTNSDTRQRDEPTPWNCPKCHTLVEHGTNVCPTCGHIARAPSGVQIDAGILMQIERTGTHQKQAVYAMLNCIRHDKGYKDGWVSNQYKDIFGVWPKGLNRDMILTPVPALRDYLEKKRKNFLANKHIRENYRSAKRD
jgi:superfamily II DNA or RNA helicase